MQVWPSAANFVYLRVKAGEGESAEQEHKQIMQQLKEGGTLIRHTGGGLRITVGSPEENQRTVDRIAAILASQTGIPTLYRFGWCGMKGA